MPNVILLTKDAVFKAMKEYLESKDVRFNKDMLDQYVNMRLPIIKSGARVYGMPPAPPRATMNHDTLRQWCKSFKNKYCE